MYHYGYVKPGKAMLDKLRYQIPPYHGDQPGPEQTRILAKDSYEFEDYDIMKNFPGSHPVVMNDRVRLYPRLKPKRNRWLAPAFYQAVLKRGFRG